MFKGVDVGITIDVLANDIQNFTNEVSLFPEPLLSVKVGFGLQKENEDLLAKLSEFLKSNPDLFTDLKKQWNSIKLDSEYLDTILESTACTLNVIAKKRS